MGIHVVGITSLMQQNDYNSFLKQTLKKQT